jgi:hypothetical protein
MTKIANPLTPAQLEILKVMAQPVTDADLRAIKKLIVRYFADKMTEAADAAWDKNEWTAADAERISQEHERTAYRK